MKMSWILFFIAMAYVLGAESTALADYASISIAARVRAFDENEVVVEHDHLLYKVTRDQIIEKDLKSNDAVIVLLRPDELIPVLETEGRPKLAPPQPLPGAEKK